MSHASHDVMRTLVQRIRAVEARCGRPIGILGDLQGPKLRVGKFAEGKVDLKVGQDLHARTTRTSLATTPASICPIRRSSKQSSPAIAC